MDTDYANRLGWFRQFKENINASANTLVVGNTARSVTDHLKISREKLAYLIDATSAPVCVMIPLNAWGAFIISLVASTGVENPLQTFIAAVPLNLYAIAAILLAGVVIWKNIDITVLFITHDLDEAIYLADRILVLKAHPGEVQELIEVPVPQPRSPDQLLSPEFLATKKRLEELIHPADEGDDISEDHLNMVRMVPVDDEVESVF